MMQRKIVPDIVERSSIATMEADASILDAAKIMAGKNIAAMIILFITSTLSNLTPFTMVWFPEYRCLIFIIRKFIGHMSKLADC